MAEREEGVEEQAEEQAEENRRRRWRGRKRMPRLSQKEKPGGAQTN